MGWVGGWTGRWEQVGFALGLQVFRYTLFSGSFQSNGEGKIVIPTYVWVCIEKFREFLSIVP